MAAPFTPVVHLELHTGDIRRARALYAALCGWRRAVIDTPHGSYESLDLGNGIHGGAVQCETDRALWLPYVQVGDVVDATWRAEALGASVLLAPREGPAGWRSVVHTESGGEIAFWQPKR
jgi:hypothetical protein